MKDLVSIVIPAYNASNYLAEAIDSALAQTYRNIEIIVINDGSPDEGKTREVALSYGDKIRYYEKENGGCASALNYGISVMNGKWFSWLSHDDLYLPTKVEALLDLLETYHCDPERTVLGCNDLIMNPQGKVSANLFNNSTGMLSPVQAFGETLNKKTINGCGLLIPKTVLEEVGEFKTHYRHLLDREMWMRIAMAGVSYCYAEEPLVISRVHGQQITVKAQESLHNEEADLINEYMQVLGPAEATSSFMEHLCYFAYKRNHRKLGHQIKCILRGSELKYGTVQKNVLRYQVEGTAKRLVGRIYKQLIRK